MQDIKVSNFKLDSRDNLTFKITIKKDDYSFQELQLLKNSDVNWDTLDLEITWLVIWDSEKERKSKISKLAFLMWVYCEKSNTTLEEETQKLYIRNKVNSRSKLSMEQLEFESDIYKNGLLEFS